MPIKRKSRVRETRDRKDIKNAKVEGQEITNILTWNCLFSLPQRLWALGLAERRVFSGFFLISFLIKFKWVNNCGIFFHGNIKGEVFRSPWDPPGITFCDSFWRFKSGSEDRLRKRRSLFSRTGGGLGWLFLRWGEACCWYRSLWKILDRDARMAWNRERIKKGLRSSTDGSHLNSTNWLSRFPDEEGDIAKLWHWSQELQVLSETRLVLEDWLGFILWQRLASDRIGSEVRHVDWGRNENRSWWQIVLIFARRQRRNYFQPVAAFLIFSPAITISLSRLMVAIVWGKEWT